MVAGFMLRMVEPFRYNVLFQDSEVQEQMRPAAEEFIAEWKRFSAAAMQPGIPGASRASQSTDTPGQTVPVPTIQTVRDQFMQTSAAVDAYDRLNRPLYWQAGRYDLELRVTTTRPQRTFSKRWEFVLKEADFESVRLNVPRLLRSFTGSDETLNFVYARYLEAGR